MKGVILSFKGWGWGVKDYLFYGLIYISLHDSCYFLWSGVHYESMRIERGWANPGINVQSFSMRSKGVYWLLWPTKELLADPLRPLYLFIIKYMKSSFIKIVKNIIQIEGFFISNRNLLGFLG